MPRSIRWRLQLWYALVLAGTLAGFALILYERARAARLRETDAALESAARYLDLNLRRFPARFLAHGPPADEDAMPEPDWPEPPPGPGAGPPPGRSRPRWPDLAAAWAE